MSKTAFHNELFTVAPNVALGYLKIPKISSYFSKAQRGVYIQREMCVAKFANWSGLYLDGRLGSQSRLSK